MERFERYLVTSALPYANGGLHVGHILEHTQSDVYVRFLKSIGKDAIYVCAEDTHGTPIEINAQKRGITPEQLVAESTASHAKDFADFQIHFDSYYSTNSEENKQLATEFFYRLQAQKLIYKKPVTQMYCEHDKRFLPDRFIKGNCPKCGAADQYGDSCESCNSTYSPTELKDPHCSLCKKPPVMRESIHYFFKLSEMGPKLSAWLESNNELQPETKNFVANWIKEGLQDWDISRDAPYFGFKIPGEDSKYFYVWLDAPIGYISSTANYCKLHNKKLNDYWNSDKCKIVHNIGKDISYFHFLFWPATLMHVGYNLPTKIMVHGFLNFKQEKMSKSRGIGFTPRQYLDVLAPEYMRYFLASSLGKKQEDIEFDVDVFKEKANSELVGNISNLFYRSMSMCNKSLESKVSQLRAKDIALYRDIVKRFDEVAQAYEEVDLRSAVRLIAEISAFGNKYIQDNEPWKLVKEDKEEARKVVTFAITLAKDIAIALAPVLPKYSEQILHQMNIRSASWRDIGVALPPGYGIGEAQILLRRIENEMDIFLPKEEPAPAAPTPAKAEAKPAEQAPTPAPGQPAPSAIADFAIPGAATAQTPPGETSDPFSKVDLRVAKILSAIEHPSAEKLFVLQIDLGSEQRQLVAGLRAYYKREELLDKHIVIVANLKPAMLRGQLSKGMLLAADDGQGNVLLVTPQQSKPGDQVTAVGVPCQPAAEITIEEFLAHGLTVKDKTVCYKDYPLATESEVIAVDIADGSKVR